MYFEILIINQESLTYSYWVKWDESCMCQSDIFRCKIKTNYDLKMPRHNVKEICYGLTHTRKDRLKLGKIVWRLEEQIYTWINRQVLQRTGRGSDKLQAQMQGHTLGRIYGSLRNRRIEDTPTWQGLCFTSG